MSSTTFFYTNGIFYKETSAGYQVVSPPAGAKVKELPINAEQVSIEGELFYEHNSTLYKKVETVNGFVYQVSGEIES